MLTPKHLLSNFDLELTACFDTGCGVTFVDKDWLLKRLLSQKTMTMSISLKVRRIGASKHKFVDFIVLLLYLLGRNSTRQLVYALLKWKIYLVKELQVNSLINNNILSLEGIIIIIEKKNVFIGSYEMIIAINSMKQQKQFLKKKLFSSEESIIILYSKAMISFAWVLLPDDQDFVFYPTTHANLTLYTHIINLKTSKILVKTLLIKLFVFPTIIS